MPQIVRANQITYCVAVEFVGYAARAASARQAPDFTLIPYIMQSLLLLLGPSFFAASIYMVLGRLIRLTGGERNSMIRPSWLTKIFVVGDVLSFFVQSGGMLDPKNRFYRPRADVGYEQVAECSRKRKPKTQPNLPTISSSPVSSSKSPSSPSSSSSQQLGISACAQLRQANPWLQPSLGRAIFGSSTLPVSSSWYDVSSA